MSTPHPDGIEGALRGLRAEPGAPMHPVCARLQDELAEPRVLDFVVEPDHADRLAHSAAELLERFPNTKKRPALYGLPTGVKDLFHVVGWPTRAGSRLPVGVFEGEEGWLVQRLRTLGALFLGKTAMDELAFASAPPTLNPRAAKYTPGGSSAGSAAAIAAGHALLTLGSQTSYSIIAPAAFCGVVGFKPSYGRVPADGMVPLAPSLDTPGWFTADLASARLVSEHLLPDWEATEHEPGWLPVLGLPPDYALERVDETVHNAWRVVLARLITRGYPTVEAGFLEREVLAQLYRDNVRLIEGEAARVHGGLVKEQGALLSQEARELIARGREVPGSELEVLRAKQSAVRVELTHFMDLAGIDCWAVPSQSQLPPLRGGRTGFSTTTAPWTFAGLPCLSMPAGTLQHLPWGLQLVGRHGADEALLECAAHLADVL